MVNEKPFLLHAAKYSTKSALLAELRETQFVSGAALADKLGISRVAVWKAVKALIENGYQIEIRGNGYFLDPENEKDLVYPWEFGTKEAFFRCYKSTGSTMDRMRELAEKGAPGGMAITAEKQSSGRGRNGRTWISKQGGLYFTLLERPALAVADYMQSSLIFQMAAAQAISSVGAKAYPRWPNDIYVKGKKIAGVMTEISAEGDILKWLSIGVGVNVNNSPPSAKTTSCAEISGHHVSRRDLLIKILDEAEKLHSRHKSGAIYAQGNRSLSAKWNSMSEGIGAKIAIIDNNRSSGEDSEIPTSAGKNPGRILARGIFAGIDPAGRCILKTGSENLFFNPGPASLVFLNPETGN